MKSKTTAQILEAAHDLLAERGWCQMAAARSAQGLSVDPQSPKAKSLCALTAIRFAAGSAARAEEPLDVFRAAVGGVPLLFVWNDAPERTEGEVFAAFRRAIVLAKRGNQ